jgi:hypothetical protein
MSFNTSLFPEYQTNNNEDIYPDKNDLFNGWVLSLSLLLTFIF